MKHPFSWYAKNGPRILGECLFRFLLLSCFVFTILLTPLFCTWLHINVREILPHVITFESCILAVLSIIFSLALGLKDGAIYNALMTQDIRFITSSYERIFHTCIAAVLTIVISIVILAVRPWTIQCVKVLVQLIGSVSCLYSILGTIHLLHYFTYLMIAEARKRKKTSPPKH